MELPEGYSIEKNGKTTSLRRKGVLVFCTFRPVDQGRIDEIICQIEAAQKKLGATK